MRNPRRRGLFAASATALIMAAAAASPVAAAPDPQAQAAAVKPDAVQRHLRALQKLAEANGGTRASGTPGYAASRDYIVRQLRKAGYKPTVQEFQFPFFSENSTAAFEQLTPDAVTYRPTPADGSSLGDFFTMEYSGSGDATGTVRPVDVMIPPGAEPNSSTSGCEASDFAGFPAGAVALVQRGTCTFYDKAVNAQAAGAAAVILFNEGQEGRADVLTGTLGAPDLSIPVIGTSYAIGADLADPAGTTVHVKTDTTSDTRTTWNVLAETRRGNPDDVIMSGSHLDSVPVGPGVNDNGSGSAALLELALRSNRLKPKNKMRFAWWGAEENNLLGSTHYVNALSEDESSRIAMYLNYDMIGSPNHVYFIYDGDDSDATGAPAGPEGSAEIEKVFERYFDRRGLPHKGTDFDGRSDYGPFIAAGIPSGGLFTGAEGVKTAEEAALFGGTAGQAYDPCYHAPCDTIDNINPTALKNNLGAMAFTAYTFAAAADLPGTRARASAKSFTAPADQHHPTR
ncbi:M28 family metallopeptidase [Actinocorallia populi]|uniref:M28 family metallopeptidase n=1 Tax=Actinocorallia populi TaxID=2079200 RepID=UPI000D087729|nr:M28 family metallopeptidase [Actinocorallia populi]